MLGAVAGEQCDGGDIVVTIKPLHSLVSAVVGDKAKVRLLLDESNSPHDFQLKPSQMKLIRGADVIFYVDKNFETFMTDISRAIPIKVKRFSVSDDSGLKLLPVRKGGLWDWHLYEHNHEETHKQYDTHVWLSPENGRLIVNYVARELGKLYPKNRAVYEENSKRYIKKINNIDQKIKEEVSSFNDKAFIVSHDAYQYFEKFYGLNGVGAITFEPHELSSPKRIKEIRDKIRKANTKCILREPQFSDRLIGTVVEGMDIKVVEIDPIGADMAVGEDMYLKLLENIANRLRECLVKGD
ncbi:MAG: metal ABC transporter substrate-binding protein [Rickettsiales bacterium]